MRRAVLTGVMAVLLAAPVVAQDEDPGYFFATQRYELEPVEVVEAGVSLSWPVEWPLEIAMVEGEYRLPPEHQDAGPVAAWILIRGESDAGDWCRLTSFEDHPMSLEEHASWSRETLLETGVDEGSVSGSLWMVNGELAERTVVTEGDYQEMHTYLFETGGVRYDLTCYSYFGENLAWQDMADSVGPLGVPPEPEPAEPEPAEPEPADSSDDVGVLELPGAGVELTLPAGWTFEPSTGELSTILPPPYDDVGEVAILRALEAMGPTGAWCNVYAYEQMPMSLDEHAQWFASMVSASTDHPATVETRSVSLPIGESIRLVEDYDAGEVHVLYLFDLDGARRYLVCAAAELPDDAWLSVAETIAPMSIPFPAWPDDAVGASEVIDVATLLPVTGVDEGETFMHAACDRAVLFELSDGSSREELLCRLTDEQVEDQGQLPSATVTLEGGACEWVSDVWAVHDGSEVWASSWSVTVAPDGTATATSWYEADGLDCED